MREAIMVMLTEWSFLFYNIINAFHSSSSHLSEINDTSE